MSETSHHPRTRHTVRPSTLLRNKLAAYGFRIGGSLILLMVFGILVFIVVQVLPLFQGASIELGEAQATTYAKPVLLGTDERAEYPFVMDVDGTFHFFDLEAPALLSPITPVSLEGAKPQAWSYAQEFSSVALALSDGRGLVLEVEHKPVLGKEKTKQVESFLKEEPAFELPIQGMITGLSMTQNERQRLIGMLGETPKGYSLQAMRFQRRVGLLSSGKWEVDKVFDITPQLKTTPEQVLAGGHSDLLLVSTAAGEIEVFELLDGSFQKVQAFRAFDTEAVASMHWLAGQRSVLVSSPSGELRIFTPAPNLETGHTQYGLAQELDGLSGPLTFFAYSIRNRSFLAGSGHEATMRYGTTGALLWDEELSFEPVKALIGPRYRSLLFLSDAGDIFFCPMDDPHPEASFEGFFGKIRYEGQNEARYIWQSTGGGDAFEPKLSLIPLLIGTFKGTLYAMLFALPLALSAAMYSAHFLSPELRRIIKPTMEIMASLPSVVIGFLAALWLAPILDDRVPSVLLGLIFIPLSAIITASLWDYVPVRVRKYIPEGREFIPMLPIVVFAFWLGWQLGPVLESLVFTVQDASTGEIHADFRLWWQEILGMQFEQRNALVIGFMMGFAVIPIIFTLSEEAMANVPRSLLSGSLALGASRWQTAYRIVLPMSMPGILSALMIGLGRAVGETMIVVMATGNTPLTSMNIFSGMRTLAANIAVELPEAPFQGTLYRTLFLGAMLLFILTFFVNTFAELMRERIRKRYRSIA